MHVLLDALQALILLGVAVMLIIGAMAVVGHFLGARVPPREFDH